MKKHLLPSVTCLPVFLTLVSLSVSKVDAATTLYNLNIVQALKDFGPDLNTNGFYDSRNDGSGLVLNNVSLASYIGTSDPVTLAAMAGVTFSMFVTIVDNGNSGLTPHVSNDIRLDALQHKTNSDGTATVTITLSGAGAGFSAGFFENVRIQPNELVQFRAVGGGGLITFTGTPGPPPLPTVGYAGDTATIQGNGVAETFAPHTFLSTNPTNEFEISSRGESDGNFYLYQLLLPSTAVPEVSSAVLFGLSALAFGLRRKRS